jgi:hypothetical protein
MACYQFPANRTVGICIVLGVILRRQSFTAYMHYNMLTAYALVHSRVVGLITRMVNFVEECFVCLREYRAVFVSY